MTFFKKAFQFVVFNLVIFGCFDCKIATVGARDPVLWKQVNKRSEPKREVLILYKDDLFDQSSYHKQIERRDNNYSGSKAESFTIDDEDGEREKRSVFGSGDGNGMNIQADQPAEPSPSGDRNLDGPTLSTDLRRNISARSPDKIISGNSTTITVSTPVLGIIVSTSHVLHHGITSRSAFSTPLLSTIHGVSSVRETKSHTNVFTSLKASFSTSVVYNEVARASSVVRSTSSSLSVIEPTPRSTKTIRTSTKESNVLHLGETPKSPSPRKETLFGFVTVEILVALLAGAACAVILVVFLVYRLKKRSEGSYELQESLMLKSGAYSDEKEVFV